MSKETGGPAFASQLEVNRDGYAVTGGMTLRDYFAAEAMPSILAPNPTTGQYPLIGDFEACAKAAYAMADAMLKAREQ